MAFGRLCLTMPQQTLIYSKTFPYLIIALVEHTKVSSEAGGGNAVNMSTFCLVWYQMPLSRYPSVQCLFRSGMADYQTPLLRLGQHCEWAPNKDFRCCSHPMLPHRQFGIVQERDLLRRNRLRACDCGCPEAVVLTRLEDIRREQYEQSRCRHTANLPVFVIWITTWKRA